MIAMCWSRSSWIELSENFLCGRNLQPFHMGTANGMTKVRMMMWNFNIESKLKFVKLSLSTVQMGWVALSSLRRPASVGDISTYLHNMMFQTIQTIYILWGYDPGNISVSTYAELSPVYCCLVSEVIQLGSRRIYITAECQRLDAKKSNLKLGPEP